MKSPYRHDWLGAALWIAAAFIAGTIATLLALLTHTAIAHWSHP